MNPKTFEALVEMLVPVALVVWFLWGTRRR